MIGWYLMGNVSLGNFQCLDQASCNRAKYIPSLSHHIFGTQNVSKQHLLDFYQLREFWLESSSFQNLIQLIENCSVSFFKIPVGMAYLALLH